MAFYSIVAQRVLGDPASSGRSMNIVSNQRIDLLFDDDDGQLGPPLISETVSLDGGATFQSYEFLGFGDVRGDGSQLAGFIRIELGDGAVQTLALDMNADLDGVSDLSNGNTKLKTSDLQTNISLPFPYPPACFTPGTLIDTATGRVPIETMRRGDRVWTLDHGYQKLRGIARQTVSATGDFAPIRFEAGALGNSEPLLVSPQHRMYLTGWQAELYFGEESVLIPAKGLINDCTIRRVPGKTVTYIHLLFSGHEIVRGAGTLSESYFVGRQGFASDGPSTELHRLFPKLGRATHHVVALARPQIRPREAHVLRTA